MREDRDFENIIESMGAMPKPIAPPTETPEPKLDNKGLVILKTMFASLVLLALQVLVLGALMMVLYELIAETLMFPIAGIGYWTSVTISLYLIAFFAIFRKAIA